MITILLGAASVTSLACPASPARARDNVARARTMLFIGNSLTYANELPLTVRAMANSSGSGPLEVSMVAFPDFSARPALYSHAVPI